MYTAEGDVVVEQKGRISPKIELIDASMRLAPYRRVGAQVVAVTWEA
jgi:hypothetical protein